MKNTPTKRLGLWRWSWLAFAAQAACATAASNDEFLDMSLEELVDYRLMSMSRKEQRVADMAAAAYVISSEEIRRSGAQSIPEALRQVPGLNVAQISRSRWAVSSRGFNERFSTKLLVQVDGRSIYSPLFSGVLWETQDIVMEDIERIEVIRGPGAALWGTNAMNGVINIVTRSAAASQGSMLSASLGSGGLASVSMTHGGELAQGGHYKVFGKTGRMDGSVARDTGAPGEDQARQQRLGIRIEPRLALGQLSIKAEVYQDRSQDVWGMPSVRAFSVDQASYSRDALLSEKGQGMALQARYTWKGARGADNALQASIDHDRSDHTGLWGSGTGPGKPLVQTPAVMAMGGKKTDIDVDFQQRQVFGVHDFIWGLNLRHTSDHLILPSSPYRLADGQNQRVSYSAFVHDEITLAPDSLKLIVGSKFEKDGLTGFNVQPNVRLLYTPAQHEVVWGALSRSVRSLRRTESQATVDVSAQDAHELNPAIPPGWLSAVTQVSPMAGAPMKAEEALSLEAGWRKQFSNFLSVDTALFVTDYQNLRGARMLPNTASGLPQALACLAANGPGACYVTLDAYNSNVDKARSLGGEVALEWHPRAWWKVQAHYSHLRVKATRTGDMLGDIQVNAYENSAPRHQFSLHNNFSLPHNLNLDVRLRYNSGTGHYTLNSEGLTMLPAYTGLDMRLAWKAGRHTELSVLGRNLLKDRHTEFINIFPMTRAYDVQRSVLVQAVTRF
ncbi:TonB-dependent receptor [Limnohabitans sp.]|uniref:TonB-dependent receptor plug domain-containing protein n=1 Tax=Limnohabitans sp. TaxID=1907725 RepID=UPI0025BD0FBA|nr:TonB-dependent receptor [Limnohabitans sp.]